MRFPLSGAIHLQTNEDPIYDTAGGNSVSGRDVRIHFPVRCVESPDQLELGNPHIKLMDTSLKELFRMPEYRDEFIRILLDVYHKNFAASRKLVIPDTVKSFTVNNLAMSLSVGPWFCENYVITKNKADLIERTGMYQSYLSSLGPTDKRVTVKTFNKELRDAVGEIGPVKKPGTRGNEFFFCHLIVRPPDDENDANQMDVA